jgi:hypothetical protein
MPTQLRRRQKQPPAIHRIETGNTGRQVGDAAVTEGEVSHPINPAITILIENGGLADARLPSRRRPPASAHEGGGSHKSGVSLTSISRTATWPR